MVPRTDPSEKKSRRASLVMTISIHAVLLVALFVPLLTRVDIFDLRASEGGDGTFEILVSESALGEPYKEITEEIEEETPEELLEEADSDASENEESEARPLRVNDRSSHSDKDLLADPTEDPIIEANKESRKEKEKPKPKEKPKRDFASAFGRSSSDAGGGGADQSGPNPSNPGLAGVSLPGGISLHGLDGRHAIHVPPIDAAIRENGTVVVRICIDEHGQVTRANYTQAGTSASTYLKQLAEKNACDWRFSNGDRSLQCGKIIFNFKVK